MTDTPPNDLTRRCQQATELSILLTDPFRGREFLAPIFRGSPADPSGEGVRKDEWILVTDFLGDGFDGPFGGVQQFRGATHPEIGDLVNGTAPELTLAKAAQVFFAVTGFPRQPDQRPKVSQAGRD